MRLLFTSLIIISANVSTIIKCGKYGFPVPDPSFLVLESEQQQQRTEAICAKISKYLISSTASTSLASLSRPLRRYQGHSRTCSHFNIVASAAPPAPLAFDRLRRTTGNGRISPAAADSVVRVRDWYGVGGRAAEGTAL
jgi:hypothetical protein